MALHLQRQVGLPVRPHGQILVNPIAKDRWIAALKRGRSERVQVWLTAQGQWRARAYHQKRKGTCGKGEGPYTLTLFTATMGLGGLCTATGGLGVLCTCEGWVYTGVCKHAAVLASRLAHRGATVRLDVGFTSVNPLLKS